MLLSSLNFKNAIKALGYSFKLVFDLLIDLFRGGKTKVLAITSGPQESTAKPTSTESESSSSNTTKLPFIGLYRKFTFLEILQAIYGIPKVVITPWLRALLKFFRDLKHYYVNFYLKNRPVSDLYPEYKSLNISKSVRRVIRNSNHNYSNLSTWGVFLRFFQYWVIPCVLGAMLLILLFTLRDIPVNKFLFTILSLGFFVYLLLSGFVFFFKKYKYSKYTTAMHRYWRRTFSIFWLLEGYLFLVFLYLAVFANSEPYFMYDNMQAFKTLIYPWRLFMQEAVALVIIIAILRYFLIRLKDMTPTKLYIMILSVTAIMLFMTWSEFYQFFYTLNHYNSINWTYDEESFTWSMETETKKTRILLHYITLCIIAKFWHFVFILGFWIFSVLRWSQLNTVHYPLLGANLQNFIILYLLNWIVMYPWVKHVFRRHLFKNYTWLYTNFRNTGSRIFFIDALNYFYALIDLVKPTTYLFTLELMFNYLYCCCTLNGATFSEEGLHTFMRDYIINSEKSAR